MPLEIGTRLGPYEVLETLGSGTSGEVYRAQDMKLGRQVAIKILREEVAEDEEIRARFGREARALASLNVSSVAAIYGLEEYDGVCFLVLELILGQTLKQRLREGGALPVREALTVALHVAEALEGSHGKGIVHRDLNPANIKITPQGKTKLVDFGLAKSVTPGSGDSLLGTPQTLRTKLGVVMGTPPYMSPEQTLGVPVDKGTDIWAFGCVLYEALVGKRAFRGATIPDVWEAIQGREPDWSALPAETPEKVKKLLERCLCKVPAARLQDIAEARVLLDEVIHDLDRPQGAASAGQSSNDLATSASAADGIPGVTNRAPQAQTALPPAPSLNTNGFVPARSGGRLVWLSALVVLLIVAVGCYFLFMNK